jgi:hypothetical protein
MKAVNLEKLLPSDIPPGERILWHGRPEWVSLARRAFRADFIAAYFVAMTLWNTASTGYAEGFAAGAIAAGKTAGSGVAAIALLALLAWLTSRTTLYVITSRRLVMKIGIALPMFINLPFSQVASGSLRLYSDGTGDIPVALTDAQRVAYLHLWPHARPFRFKHPEPALRSVARAADVAEALSRAVTAASDGGELSYCAGPGEPRMPLEEAARERSTESAAAA